MFEHHGFQLILLGRDKVGKSEILKRLGKPADEETISPEYLREFSFGEHMFYLRLSEKIIRDDPVPAMKVFNENLVFIYVFDLTRIGSFHALCAQICLDIETHPQQKLPIILVANKYDLLNQREVTEDDIDKFARRLFINHKVKVSVITISTKTNLNIELLLLKTVSEICSAKGLDAPAVKFPEGGDVKRSSSVPIPIAKPKEPQNSSSSLGSSPKSASSLSLVSSPKSASSPSSASSPGSSFMSRWFLKK